VPLIFNTRRLLPLLGTAVALFALGCKNDAPPPAAAAPQAMPVQVAPVSLSPVPSSDTYVATIKSRRSATMQPQVEGNLTRILVKSGDVVKAGQLLMQIDPLKQVATVQSQQGTEAQKRAVFQYNQSEVERQRKLYEAGVTSKQASIRLSRPSKTPRAISKPTPPSPTPRSSNSPTSRSVRPSTVS
jgi:multidrug efflux pump subunit AcrA (membrane-fusion protein)